MVQIIVRDRAKRLGFALAFGTLAIAAPRAASANIVYDTTLASPGVYFGHGNPNSAFTVYTNAGIELGLATELRYIGNVTPTSTNIYDVAPGTAAGAALWDFVYSVNVGGAGLTLSQVTPTITITNLANGLTFSGNPLAIPDNAGYGPSGVNVAYNNLGTDYGFQNAENLSFSFLQVPLGFDPNQNDTYDISLSLNEGNTNLGSVSEVVNVGSGVPEPATWAMMLIGFGLVGMRLGKRRSLAA